MDQRYNDNNTCLECGYSNDYHYDMEHEFMPAQDTKEIDKNISLLLQSNKDEKIDEEDSSSVTTSSDEEN